MGIPEQGYCSLHFTSHSPSLLTAWQQPHLSASHYCLQPPLTMHSPRGVRGIWLLLTCSFLHGGYWPSYCPAAGPWLCLCCQGLAVGISLHSAFALGQGLGMVGVHDISSTFPQSAEHKRSTEEAGQQLLPACLGCLCLTLKTTVAQLRVVASYLGYEWAYSHHTDQTQAWKRTQS